MKNGPCSKVSSTDLSAPIELEPIPITQVSSFFGKSEEGSGETWRASLMGSPNPAWVKLDDNPRRTIADLVCAQVGRAMGLPIPKPFLVHVQPEDIPADSAWHGRTSACYCFASRHEGKNPQTFARLLTGNDAAARVAISRWSGLHATMIFDEWIANDDRHNGNMLYDPEGNGFWLIDHGRALTGDYWPLWGLDDPAVTTGNMLADAISGPGDLTAMEAVEIARASNASMFCATRLQWQSMDMDRHIERLDSGINPDTVRNFLVARIQHSTRLLMARIGHPQLDFAHGNDTRPVDACLH